MHFGALLDDFNSKEEQGDYGEHRVHVKIAKIRKELNLIVLYRSLFVESKGRIYQIDHVLVTENGIFVIETKAMRGKIHGEIDRDDWHSGVAKHSTCFLNPLIQNKLHVEALMDYLGAGFNYHSIIVFTENNKPMYLPNNVLNLKELQEYLLSFDCENKLSDVEAKYLKERIDELAKNRAELKHKHIMQIKERIKKD